MFLFMSLGILINQLTIQKAYIDYVTNNYENNQYCFNWIVLLKETNEQIGAIDAVKVSLADDYVEMGYCFESKNWNKGYATESLKAFIHYMFTKTKVGLIIACHISTNTASGIVMQKAGMKYNATLKNYLIDKNTNIRTDKVCYSISKEDYLLNYNDIGEKNG